MRASWNFIKESKLTTTTPTTATAERLVSETGQALISLYMPTHRAGSDIWQDPIRFKNLLRTAEQKLEAAGDPRSKIDSLLEPLIDLREDRKFWQYQGDGLALFRSKGTLDEFRLPSPVPELCLVGPRFHLKPLLLSLAGEQTFYVLPLSQHGARLYRGSPNGLTEISGLDLPKGWDHTERGGDKLADFCRAVDQVVKPVVSAYAPVILVAVDYLASIYRNVSLLRELAATTVSGSPDSYTPDKLFAKALPIANHHLERRRCDAESQFLQNIHTGRALDQPLDAIQAARQGRVETLFVPIGVQVWGHIDGDGEIQVSRSPQPQDQDLLNMALIDTWKSGGHVFAVNPAMMPGGRTIAAVTRF
jgi:hypothetical protein